MPPKRKNTSGSSASAKKTKTAAPAASTKQPVPAKEATGAPAEPAAKATGAPSKTAPAAAAADAPRFAGKFDLYAMQLPFLRKKYLPAGGARGPDFAGVHREILVWQAKPDFSMRLALGADGGAGRFVCTQIVNPMSDEELAPVRVANGAVRPRVHFGGGETAHASMVGAGAAWEARMGLGAEGCGMIEGGKGVVKMRRVWVGADGAELFEGAWELRVRHGPTLRRKGFGGGDTYSGGFWAVRARRDAQGEEIGIEDGNGVGGARAFDLGLDDLGEGEDEDEFDEFGLEEDEFGEFDSEGEDGLGCGGYDSDEFAY